MGSFLCIARALWKNMNNIVHEDGSGVPQQIHSEVQVLLCGLCPMLTQDQPFSINQGCCWKPPPLDWLKVNIDGALYEHDQYSGMYWYHCSTPKEISW